MTSKPEPSFTMDSLIAELEAQLPSACEVGVRTCEVAAALDIGETTARKMLNQLREEGRIRVVRIRVEALNGKSMTVPAYQILPATPSHSEEE